MAVVLNGVDTSLGIGTYGNQNKVGSALPEFEVNTPTGGGGGGGSPATTGAITQPAITIVSSTILASGTYSSGIITNTTNERIFIGLGFVPTTSSYSLSLAPLSGGNSETYIIDQRQFTGDINAISGVNPVSGNLNVTALN
jgi:hypothetical protein